MTEMKHYKFGGSTAERTVGCPAWVNLAAKMPEQGSSKYADKGTLLHNCMEEIILNAADDGRPFTDGIQEYLGDKYNDQVVTQEDIDFKLIPACNAFQELIDQYGIEEYEAETTMEYDEDTGGTTDVAAAAPQTAFIVDWKFGDGIQVYPDNNGQGLFYAGLARRDEKLKDMFTAIDKVVIVIIQPSNKDEPTLRVWETTPLVVNDFWNDFSDAVVKSKAGAEIPNAGKWCKFCPAMATCPEKTGLSTKMKRLDPKSLEKQQVTEALHIAEDIEEWIKAVRTFAHDQMNQGVKFDDYKLVAKKAIRKWTDPEVVEDKVRKARKLKLEECSTIKIMSPAQLEKVCKAKKVDYKPYEKLYTKVSSGTTIAHADDKRPEFVPVDALKQLQKSLT